jgi:hypothetical protein
MGLARLALGAAVAACLLAPSSAPAATKWLCQPGATPNPCTSPLTATVIDAGGGRKVERTPVRNDARYDCFYVYPTVSSQPTDNANLNVDPEQTAIAQYQASRFSQGCRMYAPVYRQLTLSAISKPRESGGATETQAYTDVQNAWREYLRKRNKGRGVVLIGHSQGSFMLRELIKREIDDKPAVRRKLISALLLGGNVEVRKGSDRGGDFDHVPACRKRAQTGCVVGYSMYDTTPPADARFAKDPSPSRQILCTNPAALGGGTGPLDAFNRTSPFPGTLGIAVNSSTDPVKGVTTPWIEFPGRGTAQCKRQGDLTWLQVTARPNDPRPTFRAAIGADWGLHLGDVNLALGQLTELAASQATSYLNGRR